MKRGDVVTVALAGDYGKPRPAIVVQSDLLQDVDSILVVLLTSTIRDLPAFRIDVTPTPQNGLLEPSQIMVEKIHATHRERCKVKIGVIGDEVMSRLEPALMFVFGLANT